MAIKIPIEVSARHIHLSQGDLEALFGSGYKLKKLRQLTQQSDFAAEEFIDIKNGENIIRNVRVVGPLRLQTQVEITLTDAYNLGINPPIRNSGDLQNSTGVTLVGPHGELELKRGVIISSRHLHCSPQEARQLNLKDTMMISVKTEGKRAIVFRNIKVRVGLDYKLSLQLDTDEGNAAWINKTGEGYLID